MDVWVFICVTFFLFWYEFRHIFHCKWFGGEGIHLKYVSICLSSCISAWLYLKENHCIVCTVDNKAIFILCQNADGRAATVRHSIPLLVLVVRTPSIIANMFAFIAVVRTHLHRSLTPQCLLKRIPGTSKGPRYARSKYKKVQTNAYLFWHWHTVCTFSAKFPLSSHKTTLKEQRNG